MITKVIGFGHRSRVGKDTCGKFLATELKILGVKTTHVSFAWKLKETCYDLYAWAGVKRPIHYENYPEDRKIVIPVLGMTVVELWVLVGNKLRDVYPRTWIDLAMKGNLNTDLVIITDVRYPNEVEAIQGNDGKCFKVTNSRAPILDTVADNALEGFVGWDDVYQNEFDLAELHERMRLLALELKGDR